MHGTLPPRPEELQYAVAVPAPVPPACQCSLQCKRCGGNRSFPSQEYPQCARNWVTPEEVSLILFKERLQPKRTVSLD